MSSPAHIAQLRKELAALAVRVAELEKRLPPSPPHMRRTETRG
jgi:hypothetical protein